MILTQDFFKIRFKILFLIKYWSTGSHTNVISLKPYIPLLLPQIVHLQGFMFH